MCFNLSEQTCCFSCSQSDTNKNFKDSLPLMDLVTGRCSRAFSRGYHRSLLSSWWCKVVVPVNSFLGRTIIFFEGLGGSVFEQFFGAWNVFLTFRSRTFLLWAKGCAVIFFHIKNRTWIVEITNSIFPYGSLPTVVCWAIIFCGKLPNPPSTPQKKFWSVW